MTNAARNSGSIFFNKIFVISKINTNSETVVILQLFLCL